MTSSDGAAGTKRLLRFWIPFVGLGLAAGVATVPVIPCDSGIGCVEAYRERMERSRLPGLPSAQAAAIRAWAWSDTCGRCRWGARISLLRWMFDDRWELRPLRSQRP